MRRVFSNHSEVCHVWAQQKQSEGETMNTPTHTPGPWAVEPRQWDHGASLAIVAPNSGYIVAVVPFDEDIQTVDEPDYDTVKRHPNEVPNAHLIAAAPAMYEALQIMVRAANVDEIDPLVMFAGIERAKGALAQAEGRG